MGCGCSRRVAIGVTVWFFTREWMNRYYTFHINLFLSLGIQQTSLLYSMILYLYSFLCVNIRFDLENVIEQILFFQIKHVEARSSLCEGDTYRSTKFPWSALPIPPWALFGGKVKVSISLAWESINPLQFLEIMYYENALAKLVTRQGMHHPQPTIHPHASSFSRRRGRHHARWLT